MDTRSRWTSLLVLAHFGGPLGCKEEELAGVGDGSSVGGAAAAVTAAGVGSAGDEPTSGDGGQQASGGAGGSLQGIGGFGGQPIVGGSGGGESQGGAPAGGGGLGLGGVDASGGDGGGTIPICDDVVETCDGLDNNCDGLVDNDLVGCGLPCSAADAVWSGPFAGALPYTSYWQLEWQGAPIWKVERNTQSCSQQDPLIDVKFIDVDSECNIYLSGGITEARNDWDCSITPEGGQFIEWGGSYPLVVKVSSTGDLLDWDHPYLDGFLPYGQLLGRALDGAGGIFGISMFDGWLYLHRSFGAWPSGGDPLCPGGHPLDVDVAEQTVTCWYAKPPLQPKYRTYSFEGVLLELQN